MKTSIYLIRISFLLLGVLALLSVEGFAQMPEKGKSTIKVHATFDDNDKPVRRAQVSITAEEAPFRSRRGITDSKGDVTFNNVAAGSYQISLALNPRNGSQVVLANSSVTVDGSSKSEAALRAKRGAALTGKITYSDGEPVMSARVSTLRRVGKQWRPGSDAVTDDRGIYRIYPLAEGEYIISAGEEGWVITELPDGSESQQRYGSVSPYYYGGTSLKSAEVVQVEAGREISNLNITFSERALFKLSGIVSGAGVPLVGVRLSLRLRDDSDPIFRGYLSMGAMSTETDQKGTWLFNNVPEGAYYVEAGNDQRFGPPSPSDRSSRPFVWEPYPVNVANGDVENVLINASEGARVSGTVVVEGDKPLSFLQISLRSKTGTQSQRNTTQIGPGEKGEFAIEGIAAGEYFLLVSVFSPTSYVKSVVWNSRDLQRFPLVLSEGNDQKGIRIVLATDLASVRARLTNPDNSPVSQKSLLIFPVDELRWNTMTNYFTRTDRQGNFNYQGPPGEYGLAFVPRNQDPVNFMNYLRDQIRRAPRVTLKPGEQNLNEIVMPAP